MSDDISNHSAASSNSSSGSFSFKRPNLRTPFKKNSHKAREATSAAKKQSLEEFHQQRREQLFDIEESQSQPNSPESQPKATVLNSDNDFLRALRGSGSVDAEDDNDSNTTDYKRQQQEAGHIANNPSFGESSQDKGAMNDVQTKANNDFLQALRGESDRPVSTQQSVASSQSSSRSKTATTKATSHLSAADQNFLANMHGGAAAAPSPSSSPKKQSQGATKTKSQLSAEDQSFLSNMHGAAPRQQQQPQQQVSNNARMSSFSETDNNFLAQVHGAQTPAALRQQVSSPISPPRATYLSSPEEGSPTTRKTQRQHEITSSGSSKRSGNSNNNSDLVNANAAFLGALHASVDDGGGEDEGGGGNVGGQSSAAAGSFIMDSTPNVRRKNKFTTPQSSSDVDAAFLMGTHNKTDHSSSTQDSGTFVFKAPTTAKDPNAAFMMAINTSADDAHTGVDSIEGPDCELDNTDVITGESDEVEDEDIEGLTVPSQPYIEKVMLPRPLFFGNVLPPRIMDQATLAASSQRTGKGHRSMESTSDTGDEKDDSSSTGSKPSVSSFGGVGKHQLEPTIAPCCRNLEGAIETFGFGINPFASAADDGQLSDDAEPNAPHPYVSLYSPVWEDWARTVRVKARHKKARLMSKASARSSTLISTRTSGRQNSGKINHQNTNFRQTNRETGTSSLESSVTSLTASLDFSQGDSEQVTTLSQPQDKSLLDNNRDFSQDQFLKFARAGFADGSTGDTFDSGSRGKVDGNGGKTAPTAFMPPMDSSGTFVQMDFVEAVKSADDASDDDSVKANEERKSVGLNDNISAAAAMLAGEGVDVDADDDAQGGVGTSMSMAVGGGAKAGNKYGRPYTNFELTNGCIPQFGCDDPSLPHESDLGVFQTKEEEKRSAEERRERNIIDDLAVPGIMPHVACPTQCTDVDDSQCWNARFSGGKLGIKGGSNTMLISLDGSTSAEGNSPSTVKPKQRIVYETSRVGWWNLPTDLDDDSGAKNSKRKKSRNKIFPQKEVFPAFDDPIPLDVQTKLWPPSQLLRENNMSSTRLHPATSAARVLPHLSDRPASMRHIQIDTTAVGFPKLGGEIEPMFCRLAIYHFEMKSSTTPSGTSIAPNLSRCGPVTEALNFDIVQDPSVINSCKDALWPYASDAERNDILESPSTAEETNVHTLEGTTCGVFSLPSNLSLSNLYAVLIVNKVVAGSSEMEHYYKPTRRDPKTPSGAIEELDLQKLRENAAKSSEEFGQFITPFVFGIVPLMHIIETESAKTPVSRAVQIPLFKFVQGSGVKSILDHILVMLHPG